MTRPEPPATGLSVAEPLKSYEHHATLGAFAKDVDRTLKLAAEEWLLIPVTDLHIRNEPDLVVDLIARILARRAARGPTGWRPQR